jgi:hypothetical protein
MDSNYSSRSKILFNIKITSKKLRHAMCHLTITTII